MSPNGCGRRVAVLGRNALEFDDLVLYCIYSIGTGLYAGPPHSPVNVIFKMCMGGGGPGAETRLGPNLIYRDRVICRISMPLILIFVLKPELRVINLGMVLIL